MVTKIKPKKTTKLKDIDKGIRNDMSLQLRELAQRISKLSMQTGMDLSKLEEKSLLTWEYLQAVIEILRADTPGFTAEKLEEKRVALVKQWQAEKLTDVKKKMTYPQVICEECFSMHQDIEGTMTKCPGCAQEKLYHAPKPEAPTTPGEPLPDHPSAQVAP